MRFSSKKTANGRRRARLIPANRNLQPPRRAAYTGSDAIGAGSSKGIFLGVILAAHASKHVDATPHAAVNAPRETQLVANRAAIVIFGHKVAEESGRNQPVGGMAERFKAPVLKFG